MANERFAYDVSLRAVDHSGRRFAMRELRKANRASFRTAEVAAGKMALLKLDQVVTATDPQFLFLESDVEGVQWWPINAVSPSVDPDTRPFGYLLDLDAAIYDHDHGADGSPLPSTAVHNPALAFAMPSTLPALVRWQDDIINTPPPLSKDYVYFTKVTPPTARVHFGGNAIAIEGYSRPLDAATLLLGRLMYFVGKDAYYNLGTANDGLSFYAYVHVADVTKAQGIQAVFYCYPYTSLRKDPAEVPATTPSKGDAVWSAADRNLDLQYDGAAGLGEITSSDGIGEAINTPNLCSAKYWRRTRAVGDPLADYGPAPSANGHTMYAIGAKATFHPTPSDAAAANCLFAADGNGQPTWDRVTAMSFGFLGVNGANSDISATRIVNVWFGPQPGSLHTLRPFSYVTDRPWTGGNAAAIGLLNPTTRPASVRALYGSL